MEIDGPRVHLCVMRIAWLPATHPNSRHVDPQAGGRGGRGHQSTKNHLLPDDDDDAVKGARRSIDSITTKNAGGRAAGAVTNEEQACGAGA